jgi:hypothetical protein
MHWSIPLLAILSWGCLATTVSAVEPQKDLDHRAQAEHVAKLISKLGSPCYDERLAATRELDALGPAALPGLKRASSGEDLEVRHRAGNLVEMIQQRLETERVLAPGRVHLTYKDTPVPEAVADFGKKTGCTIQLEGDKARFAVRRLTLDTGETTFWHALELFCKQAGLVERIDATVQTASDRRQIVLQQQIMVMKLNGVNSYAANVAATTMTLQDGKAEKMPTCEAGAVRVRVLPPNSPLHSYRSKAEGEAVCAVEVTPEPRIQLLRVQAPRIHHAVDARGVAVTQVIPSDDVALDSPYEAILYSDVPSARNQQCFPIHLKMLDKSVTRIAELQGSVTIQIQMPPGPLVTVDNILQASGKTIKGEEGRSLKVASLKQHENQLEIIVEVEEPNTGNMGNMLLLNRRRALRARNMRLVAESGLQLLDGKGQQIPETNAEIENFPVVKGSKVVCGFKLVYTLDKEAPARLVMIGQRTPVLDVPFTLKNIPAR